MYFGVDNQTWIDNYKGKKFRNQIGCHTKETSRNEV